MRAFAWIVMLACAWPVLATVREEWTISRDPILRRVTDAKPLGPARRYRVKGSKKGGYFVERNAAKRKSWDIPLPLIEEDPAHVVLSCIAKAPERLPFDPLRGASAVTSRLPPMVALAECEAFGGSLGYWFSKPTWTTRFCRVRMPEESGHLLEGDFRELAASEGALNKRIKH